MTCHRHGRAASHRDDEVTRDDGAGAAPQRHGSPTPARLGDPQAVIMSHSSLTGPGGIVRSAGMYDGDPCETDDLVGHGFSLAHTVASLRT